jgi:hypothetical protein
MTNNEINQTALQEFWDKISLKLSFEQIDEFVPLFYQAKEMEKEQIKEAREDGHTSTYTEYDSDTKLYLEGRHEQYYELTYGGNK